MSGSRKVVGSIGIFGVGLIGGSLGIDLRERKLADRVVGIGRNPKRLETAVRLGAVDEFSTDLPAVLRDLDVLVLGTPLSIYEPILRSVAGRFREGTIVTDVGSAKEVSVNLMESILPESVRPVGAHPMAGRETTGVESAEPGLFEGAVCALCPTERTDREALGLVRRLWTSVGAKVVELDPARHDRIVARTSHVPHLVAAALAGAVGRFSDGEASALEFIGSGFRHTTRISAGDPIMWRDICRDNRVEILSSLREFREELERIEKTVESGALEALMEDLLRIQGFRSKIGDHRKA